MPDLFDRIHELRTREERRCQAGDPELETLLLVVHAAEEAGAAVEAYRGSRSWGTNGVVTATATQVSDELCAAIVAGLIALDRVCPDARADWQRYLAFGYERAKRENTEAANSAR
ncbi:hypothetical protein [Streptomyces synnematoformans]|uniref:NTP pyrophosphohydrolase MazG putative catalytic core domain-containing protein n=1 Tax=Streptomyces synnematoformans TaxID=415721 RepID=A0ABN2YUG9_9ACTN